MSGPNGETCENCYYWDRGDGPVDADDDRNTTECYCKRFPPCIRSNDEEEFDVWPATMSFDWCGEFKPLEDKP